MKSHLSVSVLLALASACSASSAPDTSGDGGPATSDLPDAVAPALDAGAFDANTGTDSASVVAATSPNVLSGSVSGHTMMARDAFWRTSSPAILVTDFAGSCGRLNRSANGSDLKLAFASTPAAGSYTVKKLDPIAAGQVIAIYEGWGSAVQFGQCALTFQDNADSGSVVVKTSTATTLSGTFDLMFGADRVTGTFEAPFCVNDYPADAGASACVP